MGEKQNKTNDRALTEFVCLISNYLKLGSHMKYCNKTLLQRNWKKIVTLAQCQLFCNVSTNQTS